MKILASFALLLAISFPSIAQEKSGAWRSQDGSFFEETPSRGSAGSMGGMILITTDQDWKEKWNTPKEATPQFSEASEVSPGDPLFLITFFGNPSTDKAGRAILSCDFSLLKPDGTVAAQQKDLECFPQEVAIERNITYMTNVTIEFKAESSDPKGLWTYRKVLKDRVSNLELALEAKFTVK